MTQKKTLILGIGNAIRGDDAVGLFLAREIAKDPPTGAIVRELETSGFEIIDEMAGFERVIIIDAMRTPDATQVGEALVATLDERQSTPTLLPSHGFDFASLVHTWGSAHPELIPGEILFILVKVTDVDEFREGLSAAVQGYFPGICADVRRLIRQVL